MRSKILVLTICALGAQACSDANPGGPNANARRPVNLSLPQPTLGELVRTETVPISQRESELTARLSRVTTPDIARGLRAQLANPRVLGLTVRNNPQVQALVDSIYAVRRTSIAAARPNFDATGAATGAVGGREIDSPVVIALTQHLSDPTATAMILRRPAANPHDAILLAPTAGPLELGAAMQSLARIRARDGEVPTRALMIASHGRAIPSNWHATQSDIRADSYLTKLRSSAEQDITGIGPARAMIVMMGRLVSK